MSQASREQLLSALFESSRDSMIVLAPDGTVLAWNPAAESLFGYSASEAEGRRTGLASPSGGPSDFAAAMERLRQGERLVTQQLERQHRDGRKVQIAVTYSPLQLEGALAAVLCAARDVTEQHQALEELKRSHAAQAQLAAIVESTHDAVFSRDSQGLIRTWNQGAERIYGYRPEEIIGQSWTRLVPPEELEAAFQRVARLAAGQPRVASRIFNLRKDGTRFPVSITVSTLRGPGGEVSGASVIARDLTEQERAEQTSQLLSAIEASSIDAILTIGHLGQVASWSSGAQQLFGYTAEEAIGRDALFLTLPERLGNAQSLLERLRSGEPVPDYRTTLRRADGSPVEVAGNLVPVRGADGKVTGIAVVIRDLSEQRRAEAALRQKEEQLRASQKLEAIGSLAGGVAHDFNNLLSVILGASTLGLRGLSPVDPLRAELEEIQRAAERAATLTRQLLAFSRRQLLQPTVLDVSEVVGELQPMLRRLIGEDVELLVIAPPGLPPVLADRGQLGQVLVNLVVNARDAMPSGGKLTVEVALEAVDAAFAAAHLGMKPGPHLMLAVRDTGQGMDQATLARIFEPFFSTKGEAGTGLGLATVFGIVQQSGGTIWVESEPGQGSTFRIYLPRTDQPLAPAHAQPVPTRLEGTETVLLVEDEPQVRGVVRTMLEGAGYRVLDADGPGDALLLSEQHPSRIDLLLTDVVMPHLSGAQLADRLVKVRPDLKVLYMSGYTDQAIVRHGVLEPGVEFLGKPIRPESLLRRVRTVLDAAR